MARWFRLVGGQQLFEPLAAQLVADGYLSETHGHYRFTPRGMGMFQRFVGAYRVWILARLERLGRRKRRPPSPPR